MRVGGGVGDFDAIRDGWSLVHNDQKRFINGCCPLHSALLAPRARRRLATVLTGSRVANLGLWALQICQLSISIPWGAVYWAILLHIVSFSIFIPVLYWHGFPNWDAIWAQQKKKQQHYGKFRIYFVSKSNFKKHTYLQLHHRPCNWTLNTWEKDLKSKCGK